MGKVPASVLTTVNAPYSKTLDAAELAHCLMDPDAAKAHPGHMSSFFGEVPTNLQALFCEAVGISSAQHQWAAATFAAYSGETYQIAM
jgi:hypothetical protein